MDLSGTDDRTSQSNGRVTAVRGTVVDVHFAQGSPPIGASLVCRSPVDGDVLAYVHSHLGQSIVRVIAVDSTRGLRRGCEVRCEGKPMLVPVG